ncbi:hypothetical protein PYCCODRAFT_842038 [Trametes coccinea BRFM310]|uniref:Uncharacterized protein n=1 Tax=Trametes coccinea (strain BRFM310) TaxID=1353009 RepID=A0A1Y2IGL7_TRAC3|nr:hypothetical protein PYCCODRAFT_842038 [Trametes coccinea BRFM310]
MPPPRTTPDPQPSVSPDPSIGEDVARVWHDDDDDEEEEERIASGSGSKGYLSPSSSRAGLRGTGKGKGKARERSASGNDEDEVDGATEGYPPTKEEEAEARRVAENLRRWEIAERQRRKAARESASSVAPSLLTELRSSLFRRDSHRKVPPSGPGTHHALRTDDADGEDALPGGEGVPLEEMRTPTGAAFDAPPTPEPHENPFDTPMASRTSLNIPAQSAIMTESDSIPADFAQAAAAAGDSMAPKRPTLEASSSFANPAAAAAAAAAKKQPPPPPQPLDLPAPRSPPPRTGTPHADKPPEPIPPPRAEPPEPEPEPEGAQEREQVDDGPPVRWWHEWLCGCGEGPDRGGDHQVRLFPSCAFGRCVRVVDES